MEADISSGDFRVFSSSDGFPYFVAPVFSTPAFSTPVIYSRIFHSCIFHPCDMLPHFPLLHFPLPHFIAPPLLLATTNRPPHEGVTRCSICLFVCLSSKTEQFRAMSLLTTNRKSYMGFSKNPLLDPLG